MNYYRELSKFEINEIEKYLKSKGDIYNLKYFIEEILNEHYLQGVQDKEKEVVDNLKLLVQSGFVVKGTIL